MLGKEGMPCALTPTLPSSFVLKPSVVRFLIMLMDATPRSDHHTENRREWRCTTGQSAHHWPILSEGVAFEHLPDACTFELTNMKGLFPQLPWQQARGYWQEHVLSGTPELLQELRNIEALTNDLQVSSVAGWTLP